MREVDQYDSSNSQVRCNVTRELRRIPPNRNRRITCCEVSKRLAEEFAMAACLCSEAVALMTATFVMSPNQYKRKRHSNPSVVSGA